MKPKVLHIVFIFCLLNFHQPCRSAVIISQSSTVEKDNFINEIVHYPLELNAPIFNKGYGLLYPTWKGEGSFLKSVKPFTDIAYNRFTWSALEPLEGNYKFHLITDWIDKWKKIGFSRFAFGVMSTAKGLQGTPMWVFLDNVPGVRLNDNKQIDPIYWDESYLRKLNRFVTAMGIALNGRNDIEFIDMRNIGVWGEMHFGLHRKGMWTREKLIKNGFSGEKYFNAYKRMIAIYKKAFPTNELFLNIASGKSAIVEYAAKQQVNLRYDGLDNPNSNSMGLISKYFIAYGYHSIKPNNECLQSDDRIINSSNLIEDHIEDHKIGSLTKTWFPINGMSAHYDKSDKVIKLKGVQKGKWNYLIIPILNKKLKSGNKYRLEGMVKVDRLSNELYSPYFKIQANDQNSVLVKNYFTHKYDVMAMGTWQNLWTEFRVGPSEKKWFFAVEKGTTKQLDVAIELKNLRLSDISAAQIEPCKYENTIDYSGVRCCYEFASIVSDLQKLEKLFSKAVNDPVSYINLNYRDEKKKEAQHQEIDLIKRVAKKIGFRFVLKKLICNLKNTPGDDTVAVSLHHIWENAGTTQHYNKFIVKFAFIDNKNNVIYEHSEVNELWKLMPGKVLKLNSRMLFKKDLDLSSSYTLKISLVDTANNAAILLPFGPLDDTGYHELLTFQFLKNGKIVIIN